MQLHIKKTIAAGWRRYTLPIQPGGRQHRTRASTVVTDSCAWARRSPRYLAAARLARRLAFLGVAICLSPHASAASSLYGFGKDKVAIPSGAPSGMVVAREYYSPQQLCNAATCEVTSSKLYPKGSIISTAPGPDIETGVSGLSMRVIADGVALRDTTRMTVRSGIEVQLFLDGRPPQNGTLKPTFAGNYVTIYYKSGLFGDYTQIFLVPEVRFIAGTCTVPSQTVRLSDASAASFNGVGSSTGATPFVVQFNNCPAGFNQIGYQFQPATPAIEYLPGTLALQPDSTAAGVGIRLLNPVANEYVPLGQSRPTPYDGQAGSYMLPLIASYVQTDPVVRGGSVRASALILLDYR
ncbi:fimbrial protein [Burkholderia sp. BCC0044]|uniref:fimbrial protein n=1 Tax=Burkholderia sp. BCC0044 TaxID=2676295 RepID=UPI001FC87308|nr:fimbrial protein [Burkholderia sp. BCC0044]